MIIYIVITSYLHDLMKFYFFKVFFWPLWLFFIDSTPEEVDRKQGEREGEWHAANGPQVGSRTLVRYSEDKASVHGTPALPTELNEVLLHGLRHGEILLLLSTVDEIVIAICTVSRMLNMGHGAVQRKESVLPPLEVMSFLNDQLEAT